MEQYYNINLPKGYQQVDTLNIQDDSKKATVVSAIYIWLCTLTIALGFFHTPIKSVLTINNGVAFFFFQIAMTAVFLFSYIPIHELTHAIMMKILGGTEISFQITTRYACAGCKHGYYAKKPFIAILLTPFIVWTPVIAYISFLLPIDYFWFAWFLEVFNVAGCAVDLYTVWYLLCRPNSILINDTGFEIKIFDRKTL